MNQRPTQVCSVCKGKGHITITHYALFVIPMAYTFKHCEVCDGSGFTPPRERSPADILERTIR